MVAIDPSNPEDNVRVPKDHHDKNNRTITIGLLVTCCLTCAVGFIAIYASLEIEVQDLLVSLEVDDSSKDSKIIQRILESKEKLRDFFQLFSVLFIIPTVIAVFVIIAIDRVETKSSTYSNLWRALYICAIFTGIFLVSAIIVLLVNRLLF